MVLLINKRTRSLPLWRMLALLLVVGGVAAYRWDTNISGLLVIVSYLPGDPSIAYTAYRPSLVEFLTAAGIVSYGLLAFSLGVRYLKVVDHRNMEVHAVSRKVLEKLPAPSGD
jgi:Ni/Fe-hydrogenase subunit HybB-like protein